MENESYYKAYLSKDPRFDGIFYIGITTTGIYCRPICPAKTAKKENCRFFKNPESAEKAFFRPCLRCRPELAPGRLPIKESERIAYRLAEHFIENKEEGLESTALQFNLSSRQIRRLIQEEYGVSPMELIRTRRLLLAKKLLTETRLPITEIAFISGFLSLRRFNDAFLKQYGLAPSAIRKELKHKVEPALDTLTLQLSFRPPFDWFQFLKFFGNRTIKGAELVEDNSYHRSLQIGKYKGWIKVLVDIGRNCLKVEVAYSLIPSLPLLIKKLKEVFDLNASPDLINSHLSQDPYLKSSIEKNPGLRVPGAFDGFELAVRAVVGQQVAVKAARTLLSRFTLTFGEKIDTPFEGLTHLFPTPERVATLKEEEIAEIGIIRRRARSIILLASEMISKKLTLESGLDPDAIIKELLTIPGIGKWTAHYIAMRGLRWPDAFPKEDVALLKRLGGISPKKADEISQAWRPWRSYAVLHIWEKTPPLSGGENF